MSDDQRNINPFGPSEYIEIKRVRHQELIEAEASLETAIERNTALEAENKTLRDERDAVTALLRKVPLPPLAITWEAGNKLLDELQAMAVARSGA